MAQPERPLSPFLHYLSILHRISGVLLGGCFFLLVYWLVAAAAGPERYAGALRCLGSPLTQVVLFGGLASFCFHLLNGVRHLFFDLGHGFDLATARRSGWAVAIGAIVLALLAWRILKGHLGGVA
jgi:succinate dehydrogenase / fumarate reductase cytochrome b subunit